MFYIHTTFWGLYQYYNVIRQIQRNSLGGNIKPRQIVNSKFLIFSFIQSTYNNQVKKYKYLKSKEMLESSPVRLYVRASNLVNFICSVPSESTLKDAFSKIKQKYTQVVDQNYSTRTIQRLKLHDAFPVRLTKKGYCIPSTQQIFNIFDKDDEVFIEFARIQEQEKKFTWKTCLTLLFFIILMGYVQKQCYFGQNAYLEKICSKKNYIWIPFAIVLVLLINIIKNWIDRPPTFKVKRA